MTGTVNIIHYHVYFKEQPTQNLVAAQAPLFNIRPFHVSDLFSGVFLSVSRLTYRVRKKILTQFLTILPAVAQRWQALG